MKPDWDKLMAEFKGKNGVLIADVDCTAAGKPLCDEAGVKGFPTIKWGDPDNLEDYQGGRDFKALKKFADENLKPLCSPSNLDVCDDDQKEKIQNLLGLSMEVLETQIAEGDMKIENAETFFQEELEKLQNRYQDLMTKKDDIVASVKSSGLGLQKSVRAYRRTAQDDKAEL